MEAKREELNDEKLDKLALRSLDIIESLLAEKKSLELLMRQGFLEMAKARYNMGMNSVSCVQLPSEDDNEFEASAKVKTLKCRDGLVPKTEFNLSVGDAPAEEEDGNPLRQRVFSDESKKEKFGPSRGKLPRDPLLWFGVLVPQNLRNCQRQFKEAVAVTCRIATYENELEEVRKEYKRLTGVLERSSTA